MINTLLNYLMYKPGLLKRFYLAKKPALQGHSYKDSGMFNGPAYGKVTCKDGGGPFVSPAKDTRVGIDIQFLYEDIP